MGLSKQVVGNRMGIKVFAAAYKKKKSTKSFNGRYEAMVFCACQVANVTPGCVVRSERSNGNEVVLLFSLLLRCI